METNMNTQARAAAPQRTYSRQTKNIIIHRPMQREFSFMLIALFMVASAAVAWVIHQTIRDAAYGGGFYFGKVNSFEILSDVSYQIIIRVTLVLILTLVIIAAYGVMFLHRAAGPVFRFRQILLKLNRGETPMEIKLREGDFFEEMAQEINATLKRAQVERNKILDLKTKVGEFQSFSGSDDMRRKAEEMNSILDTFYRA